MHPAVRIVGVVVLAACLAAGHWAILAGGGLVVAAALAMRHRSLPGRTATMLWRLRWLFLSIVVVFAWFTPGEGLVAAMSAWSPTWDGLQYGLQRVLVIAVIVVLVAWLLDTTSRDEQLRGLLFLTTPLARLGFPHERFAVRLALVIEAAPQLRVSLRGAGGATTAGEGRFGAIAARIGRLYAQAVEDGRNAETMEIAIEPGAAPRAREWLLLAVAVTPFITVAVMS